jgi:hypothetical protein
VAAARATTVKGRRNLGVAQEVAQENRVEVVTAVARETGFAYAAARDGDWSPASLKG